MARSLPPAYTGLPRARIDERIQREVVDALQGALAWNAADVGVTVYDGIVTLTGCVDATYEVAAAEWAALRVDGVRGVANEIVLSYPPGNDDAELARAASLAIERYLVEKAIDHPGGVPGGRVKVSVSDGRVTLRGTVEFRYYRQAVEERVRDVPGVRSVWNLVEDNQEERTLQVPGYSPEESIEIEAERPLVGAGTG